MSPTRALISHELPVIDLGNDPDPPYLSTMRNGVGRLRNVAPGRGPARRLTIRARAGKDAVRSCLPSYLEPYSPQRCRRPPLGGPQHNRIPARSDPFSAGQASPGPEQKAINRGHDNRWSYG